MHQNLVKPSSLLNSRIKLHLPLKIDESLYPPGSHSCMDFVFYELESTRGFTSVFNITFISTRHPKNFLRRSKWLPLDMLQFIINCQKREGRPTWRIRTDEDSALANSYKFNKLFLNIAITLETPAGHVSKLNKVIERPHRDSNAKTRIAMGLTKNLPPEMCFFAREHVSFVKRRTWYSSIQSTPF